MANKRLVSVIVIAVSLLLVFFVTVYTNKKSERKVANSYNEPLVSAKPRDNEITSFDENFTVTSDFSSHLPLVILDTKGDEPPINTIFNVENLLFEPIEGLNPYVDGEIQIMDNGSINRVGDNPASQSKIQIKRRGNTSMLYVKPQYLVKLITQTGQENHLSLLDMGEGDEWVINGTMTDKSMLRNYLSYRVASQIMPYVPDTKYCEVILKKNGTYTYQGVYLLGESVGYGLDRVNISQYKVTQDYNSYMVRRDRYDVDSIMLDTYATKNQLSVGYLGLRYPSKLTATPQMIKYVENDISKIEKILYSDEYSVFATYPDYINVDSFVDYFLVNEFFANYDAGNNSTYMYKDVTGKLYIGPVWDFDGAMDNYIEDPMDIPMLAFQTSPWFDRLILDKSFVQKLEKRYSQLRRSYLSEAAISDTIDQIKAHIGPAQEREWQRWNEQRKEQSDYDLKSYLDDENDLMYRNITEYEQDIYKIKTVLRKHGNVILNRLKLMGEGTIWETDWNSRTDIIILLVMALFFIPMIYIARE